MWLVAGSHTPVGANRGASGIDGVLSSAAGFAEGLRRGTTLVIGDVSFLHDVNGLNLLRTSGGTLAASQQPCCRSTSTVWLHVLAACAWCVLLCMSVRCMQALPICSHVTEVGYKVHACMVQVLGRR